MYIDCRYGQLHLATAYPSSGGFDEASPLIFLHAEDGSGADFGRCAALLGTDRSIYAPDLPGSGASDSPKGRMAVAGIALAIVDLIDHLRLRRVDLLGCGRGANVAFQLAATRPQNKPLIVVGSGSSRPPASPSRCSNSRPIRRKPPRSRPTPSSPKSAASSTASSRATAARRGPVANVATSTAASSGSVA